VLGSGNHILVQVKNNQETLLKDCEKISHTRPPKETHSQDIEYGRNRIEQRSIKVWDHFRLSDPDWRPLVKEVIMVHRSRQVFSTKNKQWENQEEISYYISTTVLTAKEYMKGIRSHWGIENRNHHVKDVSFLEDRSRIRKNPGIFARARSCALSLMRINNVTNVSDALYKNSLNIDLALAYRGIL
jgi:predicted transposase YbfD/YdcC